MLKMDKTKRNWIVGITLLTLVFGAGYFTRKTTEKPDTCTKQVNTDGVDSLWTSLQVDSILQSQKLISKTQKKKQNANKQTYNRINSVRFIDDSDSLLQSIINLTSDNAQ